MRIELDGLPYKERYCASDADDEVHVLHFSAEQDVLLAQWRAPEQLAGRAIPRSEPRRLPPQIGKADDLSPRRIVHHAHAWTGVFADAEDQHAQLSTRDPLDAA